MADVFISYKRGDHAIAEGLERRLAAAGFSAWWDTSLVAGEHFNEAIQRELKAASCVLVLWTMASHASQWVQAEAIEGFNRKILVAARLDDVALEYPYGIVQTADLRGWDGVADHPELPGLMRGVGGKVGRAPILAASPQTEARAPLPRGEGEPAQPGRVRGVAGESPSTGAARHLLPRGEGAPPPQTEAHVPLPQGEGGPAKPGRVRGVAGENPSSGASRHLLPKGEGGGARLVIPKWALPAGLAALALIAFLAWPRGETPVAPIPAAAVGPPGAPGTAFRDCANCPEMVVIPAGAFLMGSPESEPGRDSDEGPQRRVEIARFAAGKFEVTFDEYDACVADGGCAHRPDDQGWGRGRRPVINVNWTEAQAYARWLSGKTGQRYRLLTEAEWEYAARAGTTTRSSFGDDESQLGSYAWFGGNAGGRTQPVGGKPANRFGLHDVHGNVCEWVEDCYASSYSGLATNGSVSTTQGCSYRVNRGGGWNGIAQYLRSANRSGNSPTNRLYDIGFRLARTL